MYGENEDPARSVQNSKKRRLQGSCDRCKKKKVKCDSAEMPGNRCTNCLNSHNDCTHAPRLGENHSPPAQSLRTALDHNRLCAIAGPQRLPSHIGRGCPVRSTVEGEAGCSPTADACSHCFPLRKKLTNIIAVTHRGAIISWDLRRWTCGGNRRESRDSRPSEKSHPGH
ncbi:hypothetical protein C8R47DRAFT_79586 [Mycena vitilis]|nr:hypothetical protein C8R47DRAFT_79586 [Mycena vitilis]